LAEELFAHEYNNIQNVSLISILNTSDVAALELGNLPSVGNSYSVFPAGFRPSACS
jgi:hypothetical protein